jgi:hypothetical protein
MNYFFATNECGDILPETIRTTQAEAHQAAINTISDPIEREKGILPVNMNIAMGDISILLSSINYLEGIKSNENL